MAEKKRKPGRPKKQKKTRQEIMEEVALELMQAKDGKERYKGAMLMLKIQEKTPEADTAVVEPFVMLFIEFIQKLSESMAISGEEVLERLHEQTDGIEQLIRR